jgi:hypothetical protein
VLRAVAPPFILFKYARDNQSFTYHSTRGSSTSALQINRKK